MIHIVDFGMGNLGSISNMLKKISCQSVVTADFEEILEARKLILPGVGAFDAGMTNLNKRGLKSVLDKKVMEERIPILGICLGMQLMTRKSDEGKHEGLGWLQAYTRRFDFSEMNGAALRIPHMSWNEIRVQSAQALLPSDATGWRFYFVHGYYVECDDPADVMCTTHYGRDFASGVHKGNIYGVQFHPEKSHSFGMKLLEKFAAL